MPKTAHKPIEAAPVPFDEPIYVTRPMLAEFEDYAPYFKEIWNSRVLTNGGSKHQTLEQELTKTLEVPHLKLFNNGTIALLAAFRALNIVGEVITTPFTFPATPHALVWNGITPVFYDIDPHTLCIDANKIEALITEKTSAIMGVHVYGMPCDVDKIQKIADKHKLKVIYDAAHAFKTTIGGKSIGSFGDISMFSFHATKLFHTFEGGALTFKDPALGRTIDMLKNFGISGPDMNVPIVGINGKMNELQAAVGLVNLGLIEEERRKRALLRKTYAQGLTTLKEVQLFELPQDVTDSLQYIVIRVGSHSALTRNELHDALQSYNVISRKYFYPLCSDYPCYSHLPLSNVSVARQSAEEILCLPLYGTLTVNDVERIVDMIRFHVAAEATPKLTRTSAGKVKELLS